MHRIKQLHYSVNIHKLENESHSENSQTNLRPLQEIIFFMQNKFSMVPNSDTDGKGTKWVPPLPQCPKWTTGKGNEWVESAT